MENDLILKNKYTPSKQELISELNKIWDKEHEKTKSVIRRITEKPSANSPNNHFKIDLIDSTKIYHSNDIKKLCSSYRLQFLSTHYFKGNIPIEITSKIKQLEKVHETAFYNFKSIAVSRAFKFKSTTITPLILIPISDDYYYLINKYDAKINPVRKVWVSFLNSLNYFLAFNS